MLARPCFRKPSLFAAALAFAAAPVFAQSTPPGAGISNSPHDFTATSSTTVGLCTFCHTPHRAEQTKLLWNHELSALTYSWNDTTVTTGGTPLPTFNAVWQGVSKNCLSCHDGTVAIGDVAWFDAQANRSLDSTKHDSPSDPRLITFKTPGTGDLASNHPVAHPFPFQGQASAYNGTTSGAAATASGWQTNPETLGIRLFNDDGAGNVSAGGVVGKSGIECSSCHDPHNGPTVQDKYFLRGNLTGNTSDYICLKCHVK
jgi:hypothetical protein